MKGIILISFILTALPVFAHHCVNNYQNKNRRYSSGYLTAYRSVLPDTAVPRRHTVLWFTPNRRSTEIDGLALGVWAAPKEHTLIVKGVNVELNPMAMFLWFYSIAGFVTGPFSNDSTTEMPLLTGSKFPWSDTSTRANITGLSVSTTQFGSQVRGVGINLISSWANEMDGLEICGFMNMHYRFRGLSLAIRNKTTHCNGVQIGVFNECREGSLVQIGLLNRIGNRRMLFVNFRFRRKNIPS